MKFSKEIWFYKEFIFIDNRREKMIDDIVNSYLQKRPLYADVITYLGKPDRTDSLNFVISYIIYVNIDGCLTIDDSDRKFLDIGFDKDSIVSEVYIREFNSIRSRYRFN